MIRREPDNHMPLPEHAKKVFQGERWHVYQWEQIQFDGSIRTYESVKRFDTVVIYPVIGDKVIIVEEEQPHWGTKSNSIIAGGVEDGEDVFNAAARELEEESGMVFKNLYLVHMEQKSKDIHSVSYVFIAKDLVETKGIKPDAGERIEVKSVGFNELIILAKQRAFFHKPTFIDEHIIQDKVEKLFDVFKNPEKYAL